MTKEKKRPAQKPLVGIIMGSQSDASTLRLAAQILKKMNVPFEMKVVSAHRTPDLLFQYCETAANRGLRVLIAGAGGSAHLPGMAASKTHLPVIGVPIYTKPLHGLDSLLSIVQMPKGIPVACVAVGKSGAVNAALLALSILALSNKKIESDLLKFRATQTKKILRLKSF
ncbi:N5-carboxyaminoimidazole ribonucleotide mutase [Acidobacteriota bacterium]|nr:N5-carboxyaminoimidazole ribonucleotide mutase [Acidobacteriota bacterium]